MIVTWIIVGVVTFIWIFVGHHYYLVRTGQQPNRRQPRRRQPRNEPPQEGNPVSWTTRK